MICLIGSIKLFKVKIMFFFLSCSMCKFVRNLVADVVVTKGKHWFMGHIHMDDTSLYAHSIVTVMTHSYYYYYYHRYYYILGYVCSQNKGIEMTQSYIIIGISSYLNVELSNRSAHIFYHYKLALPNALSKPMCFRSGRRVVCVLCIIDLFHLRHSSSTRLNPVWRFRTISIYQRRDGRFIVSLCHSI